MKVFVYSKKNNKVLAKINDVDMVFCSDKECKITISDEMYNTYEFNTKEVKTCIYQN